jgi:hypothetical protein
MSRPDLPHAAAALFCAQTALNPATQNISMIEITPAMLSKSFPAELPPLQFVAILVGGRPGKVYTTKLRFSDLTSGQVLAEKEGHDMPFTTQIKRINYPVPLASLSDSKDIVKQAGKYKMDLLIEEEVVATAELEIIAAPAQGKKK